MVTLHSQGFLLSVQSADAALPLRPPASMQELPSWPLEFPRPDANLPHVTLLELHRMTLSLSSWSWWETETACSRVVFSNLLNLKFHWTVGMGKGWPELLHISSPSQPVVVNTVGNRRWMEWVLDLCTHLLRTRHWNNENEGPTSGIARSLRIPRRNACSPGARTAWQTACCGTKADETRLSLPGGDIIFLCTKIGRILRAYSNHLVHVCCWMSLRRSDHCLRQSR